MDLEVACLLPEQWDLLEKEGFLPLLQEPK
jgi:hypothetical protein